MKEISYYEKTTFQYEQHIQEHINKYLPEFCLQFFVSISNSTSAQTRMSYVYDLETFFLYLQRSHPKFKDVNMKSLNAKYMRNICEHDLENYLVYLKRYEKNGRIRKNTEVGIKRKFATIRKLFFYLRKNHYIREDPSQVVEMPKIHEKPIIKMNAREVKKLLNTTYGGYDQIRGPSAPTGGAPLFRRNLCPRPTEPHARHG